MIRVMLVDDQELIRTGFSLVLSAEEDLSVVAEAGTGAEAIARLRENGAAVDVILMDVRMPEMNGIDATAHIVREWPGVRVLVLTTFDTDEYAVRAVEVGAAGFLLKDARPTELVDAIRRVHAGDSVLAPAMTRRMIERLRGASEAESASPAREADSTALTALTEREREVLQLIAEGFNNQEIVARMHLTESTVKTHVGRVFQKLGVRDRVHAVILAKDLGL